MSFIPPCPIPANPDISGIGVRVAIYAQNLLSFIPAIWALWDGYVSDYELESIETQSTTILITAFAILFSAMAQARAGSDRLSSFHASIVLDLSWMNNTNTFTYFLLYVHHKSQPGPDQIKSDFACWIRHLGGKLLVFGSLGSNSDEDQENQKHVSQPRGKVYRANGPHRWNKLSITFIFRRIVLVLGSLHLSIMAGLGIWLWSDPRSFGTGQFCEAASTVILGKNVPLGSSALRAWSIAIYSLFLAPGLNLIAPTALFLSMFLGYQKWHNTRCSKSGPPPPRLTAAPSPTTSVLRRILKTWYNGLPSSPSIFPTVVSMVLLFVINLVFLVDIELTLRRNRGRQEAGESDWTFGQILAMLLLFLPFRDLIETMLARRETRRQEELAHREKQRIDEHTVSLQNAILGKANTEILRDLVAKGATVNVQVEGCEYSSVLQLAVSRLDLNFVTTLLAHGADPNILGGTYGTALQIASDKGRLNIVKLLLEAGADPNIQGGQEGTALQAASCGEKLEVAKLLLASGADPNIEGGRYGTALQAACSWGKEHVVKLLLENGADPNLQGGNRTRFGSRADPIILGGQDGTALQAASWRGSLEIVKLLLDSGADPNIQGGKDGTALLAASNSGGPEIVKLLLESGADPNIKGGMYDTALQAACSRGKLENIRLLLESGADPNIRGGDDGTALQAAASNGRLEIVKLLLENGADPNIQGGQYCTALQGVASIYQYHWNKEMPLDEVLEIVKLLLNHGADPNIQGGKYGSALRAASSEKKIVALLRTHGAIPFTVNKLRQGQNKRILNPPDKHVSSAPRGHKIGKVDSAKKLAKNRNETVRKSGHGEAGPSKSTSGTSTEAAKGKTRMVINDLVDGWMSDADEDNDLGRGWVSDTD